jgi:NADH-quinone oxidoreductase subunit J
MLNFTFPIYQVEFFLFAGVLLIAAFMVIVTRNPVRAALFLVLTFFAASALWMLLQAEFLALVLIFVYVGAVMTLFLFVVMMLNIDLSAMRERFVKFLPFSIMVSLLMIGMLLHAFSVKHFDEGTLKPVLFASDYSNTKTMGTLLYTQFLYPFEIAAALLLVGIIASITLAHHGKKPDTRSQNIAKQLKANKEDQLRLINVESEVEQ